MDSTNMQHTIAAETTIRGIGLHTGKPVTMVVKPAPAGSGIAFQRSDIPDAPVLAVSVANVEESARGTNLKVGDVRVYTVEHVLAACFAAGLDNVQFIIDGPEPPALDGSARAFFDVLSAAGTIEQGRARTVYRVTTPCSYTDAAGSITALPAPELSVSYMLQYANPVIGYQELTVGTDPATVVEQILPARTFCLQTEVEQLRARGQALGGSLENAVVVGESGVLNDEGLRFPDEFVRHKIADLLGDLGILGGRLQGRLIAIRSGHTHNVRLMKELVKTHSIAKVQDSPGFMDVQRIWEIIPHRFPFLLVDRIVELDVGRRAVGLKNVSINEPFFQGHFPGQPVTPGVLMVEALAQVAGVCILSMPEHRGRMPFFTGLDGIKFRRPIIPGDQVRLEIEVKKIKGVMGHVTARATVEGKTAVEGILKFTVM